jgi:hypothetical protein
VKRIFALGAAAALVAGILQDGGIASADQTIDNSATINQIQSLTQTAGAQTNTNMGGAQSGSQTASGTSSGSGSGGNSITQGVGNSLLQGGVNTQTNTQQGIQIATITQVNVQVATDPNADQTITNSATVTQNQTLSQTGGAQTNTNTGGAQSGSQTAAATSSGSGILGSQITQAVANSLQQSGVNVQTNTQNAVQVATITQVNTQGPQP